MNKSFVFICFNIHKKETVIKVELHYFLKVAFSPLLRIVILTGGKDLFSLRDVSLSFNMTKEINTLIV